MTELELFYYYLRSKIQGDRTSWGKNQLLEQIERWYLEYRLKAVKERVEDVL